MPHGIVTCTCKTINLHKRRSFTKWKFFKVFPGKSKQSSIRANSSIQPWRPPCLLERNKNQAHWMHALQSSTVLSLSWFYLSFGCIFRTVLGMTIWQYIYFWFSPTHQPHTVHGAARPRALGRGLALVLYRWNFSLFCMSWLVLPPSIPMYRLISKIGVKCLCYHLHLGLVYAGFRLACRLPLCRYAPWSSLAVSELQLSAATPLWLYHRAALNRIQLFAICRGGQSGKVIDLLAWRCLPLGHPSAASGAWAVEQISSSKRQCGKRQVSPKPALGLSNS